MKRFSTSHTASKSGPLAGVHRRDHRSKLVELAIMAMIKIICSIQPSLWSRSGVGKGASMIKVLSPMQIDYARAAKVVDDAKD